MDGAAESPRTCPPLSAACPIPRARSHGDACLLPPRGPARVTPSGRAPAPTPPTSDYRRAPGRAQHPRGMRAQAYNPSPSSLTPESGWQPRGCAPVAGARHRPRPPGSLVGRITPQGFLEAVVDDRRGLARDTRPHPCVVDCELQRLPGPPGCVGPLRYCLGTR